MSWSEDGKLSSNIPLDLPSIQTVYNETIDMPNIMMAIPLINHAENNQLIHKNPKIPLPETDTTNTENRQ